MSNDFLSDRKKGLEDAYFAQQEALLRRQWAQEGTAQARREDLSTASGITDGALLDRLAALGVTGETLAALSQAPLALVAWADGKVDEQERKAALAHAGQHGLAEHDAAYELLNGWLTRRPPPELLAVWKDYVAALSPAMDDAARDALKGKALSGARAVAEAAGGFLGVVGARISPAERSLLTELESACLGGPRQEPAAGRSN